jgi:prophage tail gpP-like protein
MEATAMNASNQGDRSKSKLPVAAIVISLFATFVTAGVVSWSTPDGNLVVTLVPALAVGLVVLGVALWRFRHGKPK